jgi:hypothetical protein
MERNASFWLRSIEIKGEWIVRVFFCSERVQVCEEVRGNLKGKMEDKGALRESIY